MIPPQREFILPPWQKYAISFLIAIILGLNIYVHSDPPPYGHPNVELNKQYWGVIVEVAHRWRNFDFSLWNREIAGGISLFTTGLYPLLNPTNFLAWFLNDDQFYLVKLIEPYAMGFFFMMILLWDVFKTRWYVAALGGFLYMALPFAKQTIIPSCPFFLYGCAIFPAMLFAFMKLASRHIYLAAAGVGVLLAIQFLGEGVTQFIQMIVWWGIFFTVYFIGEWLAVKHKTVNVRMLLKQWFLSVSIFLMSAVSFGAIQFIPSVYYFLYEASPSRRPGYYSINNFPIFHDPNIRDGSYSLMRFLFGGEVGIVPIREKIFSIVVSLSLAVILFYFKSIPAKTKFKGFVYLVWIATVSYFLLPSTVDFLVQLVPPLKPVFSFMTLITFRYGIYVLDFCVALSLSLIINEEGFSLRSEIIQEKHWVRKVIAGILLIASIGVAILPVVLILMPQWFPSFWSKESFAAASLKKNAVFFTIQSLIVIVLFAFRPRWPLRHWLWGFISLSLGFMIILTCFKWYDKGCRAQGAQEEEYQLTSPERQYYQRAKGKYVLPYRINEPIWTKANYSMLYGVYGANGLFLPPLRLISFQCYYNKDCDDQNKNLENGLTAFLTIKKPVPASLTTYFPVDFTFLRKNVRLPWPGFSRAVAGETYDVYERATATPQVYFADQIQTMSLAGVINQFNVPRTHVVYVTDDDARSFNVTEKKLTSDLRNSGYSNVVKKGNRVSFEVNVVNETVVIVPEMFFEGWKVLVDGHQISFFPADYLFIGFLVSDGYHKVALHYTPPWFWFGLAINILGVIAIILLFKRLYSYRG